MIINKFNHFVALPSWVSNFLKIYFVIFRVFLPIYILILNSQIPGILTFTVLNILYGTLLFLPLLFSFKHIGVLHPLIFILLFGIAKATVSNLGANFITPFISTDFTFGNSAAFAFERVNNFDLQALNIQSRIYDIVGLISFYIGYSSMGFKKVSIYIPRLPIDPIFSSFKKSIPFFAIASVVLVYLFFLSQGGITSYISNWGTSRKAALSELGVYLSFLKRIYVFPLLWFIVQGAKLKNNIFLLVTVVLTVISGFFLVGSRSGIVLALMPFFVVYILKKQNIPIFRPALMGFIFLILFGVLGQFRNSTYQKEVDWSILSNINIEESINSSEQELDLWQGLNTDIAIYGKVPAVVPYLYGKPYLGFLLFFIPRSIWSGKPHGTGYYVGRNIYGLTEAGIPPGETAEIYYNFGFFGIIFLFFLKGRLIKFVVNRVLTKGILDDIYFLVAYIVFLMNFNLTVLSLVNYFQLILFLIGLKTILGPYNATQSLYPWISKMRNKRIIQSP